ncbi:hypothetical protein KUV26_09260 [Leisingera daeponensis]|uniref:Uncharacterized protein n=1 Tax=Leisingera daeponensis TaxID=405746 RepID=A0ABS7NEH4_9RHOB|nr:hypothetical protein [Leisingera daeponensis]MBY6139617.1 hypothetical protein [Leisingera daeponensis]
MTGPANDHAGLSDTFALRRRQRAVNRFVRLFGACVFMALFFYGIWAGHTWVAAAAIWMLTPMLLVFAARLPVLLDPIVEPKHCLSASDAMRSREVWLQFFKRNWFAVVSWSMTSAFLLRTGWLPWGGVAGFWVFVLLAGFLHAKSSVELRRACA